MNLPPGLSRLTLLLLVFAFAAQGGVLAQRAPGEQSSSNVHVLSHLPVARGPNQSGYQELLDIDVEQELSETLRQGPRKGDFQIAPAVENRHSVTVIVDPPATGLTPNIRRTLLEVAPGTLIYVSCNPATLARDLTELRQKFTIESVTPLDMFPQTAEIEVAVHLQATS